ncbi:hypothetical protein D6858_13195 [Tsuneonella suprasediminis]|uniref:Uncharacterized protein n=1 Tax=Tsuneonella suprasediminis TaxID=2306996 RepID=A0A419QZ13_9SPHN|nr:hypothetical protein [Tsuneonella suprasediminis]RJX65931.1 hypothetical protein D6858_13195 [Tsuneonella suprasediminis]
MRLSQAVAPDLIRGPAILLARHWQKLDPGSVAGVTEAGRRGDGAGKNVASPAPSSLRGAEGDAAIHRPPFASSPTSAMGATAEPWIVLHRVRNHEE